MGQYFIVANLDKREYLDPHRFGDGLKLMEFGASGEGTMCGLAVLLADGNGRGGGDLSSEDPVVGRWRGDRLVIAGDYADPCDWVPADLFEPLFEKQHAEQKNCDGINPETAQRYAEANCNLYHCARAFFADVSDRVLAAMADDEYTRERLAERLAPRRADGYAGEYLPLPKELEKRVFGKVMRKPKKARA
jgi:hypothetical protein